MVNFISALLFGPFEYRFNRQNVVQSNKLILIYFSYCSIVWSIIIAWIFYHEGHVYKSNNFKSTNSFKIKNTFETNFSSDQFKPWVKPDEIINYNRIWNVEDYAVILSDEVQVTTNLVVTINQTISTCPESLHISFCQDDLVCLPNFYSTNGILTGRCIFQMML